MPQIFAGAAGTAVARWVRMTNLNDRISLELLDTVIGGAKDRNAVTAADKAWAKQMGWHILPANIRQGLEPGVAGNVPPRIPRKYY